jgi:PEGA domain
MQRAVVVALIFFAGCSFAQQNSASQDSGVPVQVQIKQATPEDSIKAEDQKVSDRKWHLHLGTVSVGAGYSRFSSPFYDPYSFYPFPPFYSRLWDPYWGYFYPAGYFSHTDGKGEVRLAAPKQADVYLDNSYAGKAEKLKSIWLEPGAYDLSVSNSDHASYHQRIYVLSGKSLKITAKLEPQTNLQEAGEKP